MPDPTHFGRKRRARRDRGRKMAAEKWFNAWWRRRIRSKSDPDGVIRISWPTEQAAGFLSRPIGPTTRLGNAEIPTCIDPTSPGLLTFAEARQRYRMVVLEDEAAAMDWGLSEIAAKAEIASETERYRDQFHGTPEGPGRLAVEQWAAASRTMQAQQEKDANA